MSPEALSFGVSELACRAVVALARVRDESPGAVARDLLGLPVNQAELLPPRVVVFAPFQAETRSSTWCPKP